MRIAVVALGKIGLPLAVQFASKGHQVVGVDSNPHVVDLVSRGTEPFPGEAGLQDQLSLLVPAGLLTATTDYAQAIPGADVVVVVVPLFVNEETWEPDFAWMQSATEKIGANLTADTLISYETTLPVGTTRHRWKPMLEELSGLKEGVGFDLVFSPERVLTGRIFRDLKVYPKLIGALTARGAKRAVQFYSSVLDFDPREDLPKPNGVWDLGSPEAAEMAKLAETTFRDVNIALANQYAHFAEGHGIDIHQVIDACNSQPYSHIHRPGIAVGGHCIPVYPRLYLSCDPEASVVRTARLANMDVPAQQVQRLALALGGSLARQRVVVLGAAYRGKVKETAFSGVFALVKQLETAGATAVVHDPMFSDEELVGLGFAPYHLGEPVDAAVVQADHPQYLTMGPTDLPGVRALLDGRAITTAAGWPGVVRLVIGVGETA